MGNLGHFYRIFWTFLWRILDNFMGNFQHFYAEFWTCLHIFIGNVNNSVEIFEQFMGNL